MGLDTLMRPISRQWSKVRGQVRSGSVTSSSSSSSSAASTKSTLHSASTSTTDEIAPSSPIAKRASGTVSRPSGAIETFFKRLADVGGPDGREHVVCFLTLQLRFPAPVADIDARVEKTWEEVCQLYPALQAEISPQTAGPAYEPIIVSSGSPDGPSTFSVHPSCENVDELFSTPVQKRSGAACYWLPRPGQVVLRFPHWLTDGFGLARLSDVFLSTLADIVRSGLVGASLESRPVPTARGPQLSSSLEDLIRKYTKEPSGTSEDASELVKTLATGGKPICLPTKPGSDAAPGTACTRAALRVSPADVERIVRACRKMGISITSALNAAIILATAQYPQEDGADAYAIFGPIDLRKPLIEAGSKECFLPIGTYVSGLPLRIEGVLERAEGSGESVLGKTFERLAQELGTFYSQDPLQWKKPGDVSDKTVSLLQLAEPYLDQMTELFATFPLPGCPFPKTPVISSLGQMDGMIKHEYRGAQSDASDKTAHVEVTDFWLASENQTPMMTFYPWTWKEQLTLQVAWNNSYYSLELAVEVFDKIIKELGKGLEMGEIPYRIVTNCRDSILESPPSELL